MLWRRDSIDCGGARGGEGAKGGGEADLLEGVGG